MATCCDYRYPPDNAIDGDEGTFWATTGGFPQELVVDLGAGVQMTGLDFVSMNVKKLSLETSEGGASDRFDAVIKQMEMPNLQDKLQASGRAPSRALAPLSAAPSQPRPRPRACLASLTDRSA